MSVWLTLKALPKHDFVFLQPGATLGALCVRLTMQALLKDDLGFLQSGATMYAMCVFG